MVAAKGREKEGSKEGVGCVVIETPSVPSGLPLPLLLPDTLIGEEELVEEVVGVATGVTVAPPPPTPPPPPTLPPKSEAVGVAVV